MREYAHTCCEIAMRIKTPASVGNDCGDSRLKMPEQPARIVARGPQFIDPPESVHKAARRCMLD
jgi:hypothetical protein